MVVEDIGPLPEAAMAELHKQLKPHLKKAPPAAFVPHPGENVVPYAREHELPQLPWDGA